MADKKILLNEVKLLYVKYCETYQAWQRARRGSDGSKKETLEKAEAKLKKIKKITEDFFIKATNLQMAAIHGTDEYKRFTIMLAYAKNAKLELMCEDPEKVEDCKNLIEQVILELEPYEDDLMEIYPLVFALTKYLMYLNSSKICLYIFQKLMMRTNNCEKDQRHFQVWHGLKLFEISKHVLSEDFIDYQTQHSILELFKKSRDTAVNAMIETASKKMKSISFIDKIVAIRILKEIAVACLTNFQLKQAQLALSVAMFNVLKIRRSLPITERSKLNEIQAALSHDFAAYGVVIISGSMGVRKCVPPNPDFSEMTDLIEPGMENYSSEFPTEYVDDPIQIHKILKKIIAWNQHSIELNEKKEYSNVTEIFKNWEMCVNLI